LKRFPAQEYTLPFFKEEGFVRKLCPKCREYFWTENPKLKTCGEKKS
jgi:alanyl-tRNA synthetase